MTDADPVFDVLGEEEVFRGFVFSVGRAHFVDPSGRPFERFVLHHPGAVAVVAVDDHRAVTLVRQFRAAVGAYVLEIPAGTRDVDGEDPEATARRELAEEAGLEAKAFRHLITTYNSPGYSDQATLIYLATGLRETGRAPAGIEESWMRRVTVSLDDLDELVANGTIVDASTVIGLSLARAALGGGR
jgi:8-oxo-dGTP pyrophosphatase MutT (NUDIX family)